MINTKYKKIFRDISSDPIKSMMLIFAIAIGLFGSGALLSVYTVINREMKKNYSGANPASATIITGDDSIRKNMPEDIKKIDGIVQAERRSTVVARMKIGNDWYRMLLFVIDNFNAIELNKFTKVSGQWPPPTGTMLVEGTALSVMNSAVGKLVLIKTSNGEQKEVPISGIVHDAGLAPAGQEQCGYGYITLPTLKWLGLQHGFDEIKILVADSLTENENSIKEKALLAVKQLENQGYSVHEIQIPSPEEHPHQSQMKTILIIFVMFCFMILILASILVSTSIATLMVKQTREIGVMKTIGASSSQISGLYFMMIFIVSVVATALAMALTPMATTFMIKQSSEMLNLNIFDASIPFWVYLSQLVAGIIIPLCIASIPISRSGRITVREALNNYGVSKRNFGKSRLEKLISKFRFYGETFTLSLRNVFRQPSRLALAIGLLAVGGAMFMTALNLSAAWDVVLNKIFVNNIYDLEVRMSRPIRADAIIGKISTLPGAKNVEQSDYAAASVITNSKYLITHTYPDQGHGSTAIYALPIPSKMINLPLLGGNWLHSENANDIVLTQGQIGKFKIGDYTTLSIDGHLSKWKVIGFVQEFASNAFGYVSLNALNKLLNTEGLYNMLRISTTMRNTDAFPEEIRNIQTFLDKENLPISMTASISLRNNIMADHVAILIGALSTMGVMMALVGAVGLMSAFSMNVFERTRELGVMKAIGATPQKIIKIVITEGAIIGLISLSFAFLLSIVFSFYAGPFIGNMSFGIPLPLAISTSGLAIWTMIVMVCSVLAILYPAWRATRMSIREALTYQ